MKRSRFLLFLCFLCACLVGCTPHTDYLAPLRGDFEADVTGELNGVTFSAVCRRESAADGVSVTFTFYAPTSLADTVAKKGPDGAISLSVGEVTVAAPCEGLSPLFDLLLPVGEVTDVALTPQGYTAVSGNGFTVTLLSDGTPYLLQTPTATATVIRFTSK